jgi:hypothetical protein
MLGLRMMLRKSVLLGLPITLTLLLPFALWLPLPITLWLPILSRLPVIKGFSITSTVMLAGKAGL